MCTSVECTEEAGCAHNLAQVIVSRPRSGLPLLFLCGENRRPELPQTLLSHVVPFVELAVYATRQHEQLGIGVDALSRLHSMVFFSPEGARTICNLMNSQTLKEGVRLFAIGPTTAAELRALGLPVSGVAKAPTPGALLDAIRGEGS